MPDNTTHKMCDNEDKYKRLQNAVYDRYQDSSTAWTTLATRWTLSSSAIRRAYAQWESNPPPREPTAADEIFISMRSPGRPCMLHSAEESTIASAVREFARLNTPLTPSGVQLLVKDYVELLPSVRSSQITFKDNIPSHEWVQAFTERRDLETKPVRIIEEARVAAVTPEHIAEHIARIKYVMERYRIDHPRYVFNLDESGCSFSKMTGRSLRKGVGPRNVALIRATVRIKGKIERVTVMPVVTASGEAYKPVVVFPGIEARYRRIKGKVQTIQDVLPDCYFFQRDIAGVDKQIMFTWSQCFVAETEKLRANGQHLLLIWDGYGAHIQYSTLSILRDNNIIVVALPAHTSHVLQPLDVSVFSSYKSYIQREIHSAGARKALNAFDIAACIATAYRESVRYCNIISGFCKTGIWDDEVYGPSMARLNELFKCRSGEDGVSLESLMKEHYRRGRSLIFDADVEQAGTVKINTRSGCVVTNDAVLDALAKREQRRKGHKKQQTEEELEQQELQRSFKEPKEDRLRYIALAPRREIQRSKLNETRNARRMLRVAHWALQCSELQ